MRNEYLHDKTLSEDGIEFPFFESERKVLDENGVFKTIKERELKIETVKIDEKDIRIVKIKIFGKEYTLKKLTVGDMLKIYRESAKTENVDKVMIIYLETSMVDPKFDENMDFENGTLLLTANSYVNNLNEKKTT